MQSIILNNFFLIENFLDIINNEHYMIMCAKYHSSNMNDACTICPTDIVGLPAKVVWPTTSFLKKKMIFLWLLCQLPASRLGSQLMKCIIITTSRIFI